LTIEFARAPNPSLLQLGDTWIEYFLTLLSMKPLDRAYRSIAAPAGLAVSLANELGVRGTGLMLP